MLRFVVLEHDYPNLHWDLMLETEGLLRTWRMSAPLHSCNDLAAVSSFDHRLLYLDYEGPISDNRGRVVCRERGTFVWLTQSTDAIEARLEGERIRGILRLERTEADHWHGEFRGDSVVS
jgi:hypothetical protein